MPELPCPECGKPVPVESLTEVELQPCPNCGEVVVPGGKKSEPEPARQPATEQSVPCPVCGTPVCSPIGSIGTLACSACGEMVLVGGPPQTAGRAARKPSAFRSHVHPFVVFLLWLLLYPLGGLIVLLVTAAIATSLVLDSESTLWLVGSAATAWTSFAVASLVLYTLRYPGRVLHRKFSTLGNPIRLPKSAVIRALGKESGVSYGENGRETLTWKAIWFRATFTFKHSICVEVSHETNPWLGV